MAFLQPAGELQANPAEGASPRGAEGAAWRSADWSGNLWSPRFVKRHHPAPGSCRGGPPAPVCTAAVCQLLLGACYRLVL